MDFAVAEHKLSNVKSNLCRMSSSVTVVKCSSGIVLLDRSVRSPSHCVCCLPCRRRQGHWAQRCLKKEA